VLVLVSPPCIWPPPANTERLGRSQTAEGSTITITITSTSTSSDSGGPRSWWLDGFLHRLGVSLLAIITAVGNRNT
jgi:hypothetical protein